MGNEKMDYPSSYLPSFSVSTHDLYAIANVLIESDGDREFTKRLFEELLKWHILLLIQV